MAISFSNDYGNIQSQANQMAPTQTSTNLMSSGGGGYWYPSGGEQAGWYYSGDPSQTWYVSPNYDIWGDNYNGGGGGGESGGGGEGTNLDIPTDLYRQSYSGLPDWARSWAEDWWGKNAGVITGGYTDVLNAYQQAPTMIEQLRTLIPEQYRSTMEQNTQERITPLLSNLAARGVTSSTVAQGALQGVAADEQARYADMVRQADTWAAQANLQNISDQVRVQENAMRILLDLLGTQRYTSESDPWEPWRDVLSHYISQ